MQLWTSEFLITQAKFFMHHNTISELSFNITFIVKLKIPGPLNFPHLHSFVMVLKLTNFMLTVAFIKMPVFLILFNFLVHQMSKYWSVQFHTDTMNHYASRACYILLIFGRWNVVSDSMQYFTFNLETKFLWDVLPWFSTTVHQRDYPDRIWRNPKFHVCPRVLDIYWHPLLTSW